MAAKEKEGPTYDRQQFFLQLETLEKPKKLLHTIQSIMRTMQEKQ